jgi:hypothetical protein
MEATLSAKLSEIVLPDTDGKQIRLGTLWASAPCVVACLRHYG